MPAKPNRGLAKGIARLLLSFPEVKEAHLPMCFVPNAMPAPAQVLVVVLGNHSEAMPTPPGLHEKIAPLLRPSEFVDIWTLSVSEGILDSVRGVGCRIFVRLPSGEGVPEDPWTAWRKLLRRFRQG